MKLTLLIVFLILSLALPVYYIFVNKQEGMLISIIAGIGIYLSTTIIMNLLGNMLQFSGVSILEDKKYYVALVSLVLTLSVMIFTNFKNLCQNKSAATLVFCGFGLVNFFIYNMNSYMNILYIGMNNSIEKLTAIYPLEIAQSLLEYYEKISTVDLFLLIAELILSFYILKNLFILVFKKDNKIFDHLFFMIFVFIYYNIQYYVTNTMVAFFLYNLILLVLIYIGRVKNGKQKAENN